MKISKITKNVNDHMYTLVFGNVCYTVDATYWVKFGQSRKQSYIVYRTTLYGQDRIVCITATAIFMNFKLWAYYNLKREEWILAYDLSPMSSSRWEEGTLAEIHDLWLRYFNSV